MLVPRRALILLPVLLVASGAWAQIHELSLTAGRTFVSTETITNPPPNDPNPTIHFGNPASIAGNYGRLIKTHSIFGLYAELPVAIYFRMGLNTYYPEVPKDIGALFATPSLRLNVFPGQGLTPWVSIGGGYGRFREAPELNSRGFANPGPTGSNTGVFQVGVGVDVWVWDHWGVRMEARDFYSGNPALNVETSNSRQHNYYVGVGVTRRF